MERKQTFFRKKILDSPNDVLVLDPIKNPLDQKVKESKVITRARTGRGHHHLPKIKECMRRSTNWVELTHKEQYEFPGFDITSGTNQRSFALV